MVNFNGSQVLIIFGQQCFNGLQIYKGRHNGCGLPYIGNISKLDSYHYGGHCNLVVVCIKYYIMIVVVKKHYWENNERNEQVTYHLSQT